MKHILLLLLLFGLLATTSIRAQEPLVLAVLDPLAADLACDCVSGFAQRDYRLLSSFLKERLDRPVELVFAGSMPAAVGKSKQNRVDIVIGKDSCVVHDFRTQKITGKRIARLTNPGGETTLTGLVVVAADDPAKSVSDLKNHRVLFGPSSCDEKYAAALALFEKNGFSVPKNPETAESCTVAGLEILENDADTPIAAVVSDYALALIEGCKTIEKGALRVIGKTEPVPFIAVFVTDSMGLNDLERLYTALDAFSLDPKNRQKLETKTGFVRVNMEPGKVPWQAVPETVKPETVEAAKKK